VILSSRCTSGELRSQKNCDSILQMYIGRTTQPKKLRFYPPDVHRENYAAKKAVILSSRCTSGELRSQKSCDSILPMYIGRTTQPKKLRFYPPDVHRENYAAKKAVILSSRCTSGELRSQTHCKLNHKKPYKKYAWLNFFLQKLNQQSIRELRGINPI